jgi:addiction module HigA family antidote
MSRLSITIEDNAVNSILPPVHPGEILREEYLEPLGLSAGALARRLNVPRTRIERLVAEETPVTVDTALRLARFFQTTPEFWMNMQIGYDLKRLSADKRAEIDAITALNAA